MTHTNISLSALAASICFVGCSSLPKQSHVIEEDGPQTGAAVLFVADPQVHNIYGLGLKQMTGISDITSKVAIRPPELNILAPLVLEHLITESQANNAPDAMVILGDTTNIACSGEYHTFIETLEGASNDNIPILFAHGNHDSYLMGTVNYYFPMDNQRDWKPANMESSILPTDESWWGSTPISSDHGRNWRDGCFQPAGTVTPTSSPMNKSRWLAKYLSFLQPNGLVQVTSNRQIVDDDRQVPLAFSAAPSTTLGKHNFQAQGLWVRPSFDDVPTKSFFTGTYNSFLVQSIDIDKTRLVIIDTSVCEKAQGGLFSFFFTNAGQHACIGDEQFEILRRYVSETPSDYKLVVAGHFPLEELKSGERHRLLSIASTRTNWVYMSAHTHHAISKYDWGKVIELNVGSTTDWPMEANTVWFNSVRGDGPIVSTLRNEQPTKLQYSRTSYNGKSELCRHLAAAKKLSELRLSDVQDVWHSPTVDESCNLSTPNNWQKFGDTLANYVDEIGRRFNSDSDYRKAMLLIAAAASKSESQTRDIAELIP